MQPDHKCSQDCETLHKEIFKKILILILSGRMTNPSSTTKNNWFGLETPPLSSEFLTGNESFIKSFLAGKLEKSFRILVHLDNSENLVGWEDEGSGRKESLRRETFLVEMWSINFKPKIIENGSEDAEIRKLYNKTSLFVRSLYSIIRLLPVYSILQQKLPITIKLVTEDENSVVTEEELMREMTESLLETDKMSGSKAFELVNRTDMAVLQTNHGDLEISIRFKKLPGKYYVINRSPAIKVPEKMITAKDIQIKSSPGSGEWIEMSHQAQKSSQQPASQPSGQIKILTTAHKPKTSSSMASSYKKSEEVTDFMKFMEKQADFECLRGESVMKFGHISKILEDGRSRKILYDRWLEELEIEYESVAGNENTEFDLLSNME